LMEILLSCHVSHRIPFVSGVFTRHGIIITLILPVFRCACTQEPSYNK
jgi:hypothetical protein